MQLWPQEYQSVPTVKRRSEDLLSLHWERTGALTTSAVPQRLAENSFLTLALLKNRETSIVKTVMKDSSRQPVANATNESKETV